MSADKAADGKVKRGFQRYLFWGVGCLLFVGVVWIGNNTLLTFGRPPSTLGLFVAWYTIVLALGIFVISLLIFGAVRYEEKANFLKKGEIRSSIAIGLTALYIILLPLSLIKDATFDFSGKFLENFWLVYIAIIGFYFGSRTIERLKGVDSSAE